MNPQIFRAIAVKHALILYARTGRRANRAYTPKNMLRVAKEITGKTFKYGEYFDAAKAIDDVLIADWAIRSI